MAIGIRSVTVATIVTTASVSVNIPSDTAVDDILIIIHGNDYYAASNMPTPTVGGSSTGVTAITNGTADAGNLQGHAKSYWFKVTAGGAATVAVTETGAADEEKSILVYVLSGADTTNPIDVAGNTTSVTNDDPHVLSAISPSTSDAFLIAHDNTGTGLGGGQTFTSPGGMSEQYDATAGGMAHVGATQQLSASGSTGTRTFDPATTASPWVGLMIAVRTSSGVAPPIPNIRIVSAVQRLA